MSRLADAVNEVIVGLKADANRLRGQVAQTEGIATVARHLDHYAKLLEESWGN